MDTPERSTAAAAAIAPLSKFEDSPVFNFINNLSPIQPVKSVHGAQTFHSLTFASIASIFTSPHANSQKEPGSLFRPPVSDFGRPESSSSSSDLHTSALDVDKATNDSVIASEPCNITCSLNEATVEPPVESPSRPGTSPQLSELGCGSPNHNISPCYAVRPDLKLDSGRKQLDLIVNDCLDKRKNLLNSDVELQQKTVIEGPLISDEADYLLMFDDYTGPEPFNADQRLRVHSAVLYSTLPAYRIKDLHTSKMREADVSGSSCIKYVEDPHVDHCKKDHEPSETDHTPQILSELCHNQPVKIEDNQKSVLENVDSNPLGCKVDSHQLRDKRRRCLVFEVSDGSKSTFDKNKNVLTSKSLPPNKTFDSASNDTNQSSLKPVSSASPCMLPGIGLHLNALATTSKDRMVIQDTPSSREKLVGLPCSIAPFHPDRLEQNIMRKSVDVENINPATYGPEDLQIVLFDDSKAATYRSSDVITPSSPKKKKRNSDNGSHGDSCKRCTCKKSKCLKLYCECFAAGVYCVETCSCQGCFNKPIHEEMVLTTRKQIESRNPLAFAPKVVHDHVSEIGEDTNSTPASARHKRGCNCKKSSCLKKYCECYQAGVGCSISCRCDGCKNAFGTKSGAEFEHEGEDMVAGVNEGERQDEDQQNVGIQTNLETILSITPLQICRSSIKQPHVTGGKPPRSSTFPFGFSPHLNIPQTIRKCRTPLPCKSDKHVKTDPENDNPKILQGNASSSNFVMTSSPNSKRVVSPPHKEIGSSPKRKGSRKLILKSIPSFPSLRSEMVSEPPMSSLATSCNSSQPS